MDAAEAERIGLVTEVVARTAAEQGLGDHLELCAGGQGALHASADHAEALAAFFERRPGRYTGR